MTRRIVCLSAFVGLLCLGAVADAQPQGNRQRGGPGGPGGFGGFGGFGGGGGDPTMMLLRMDKVREELDLLEDQVAELQKIEESSRSLFQRPENAGELTEEQREQRREEMRKRFEEFQKTARAKIAEILLPHQTSRLKQLSIQFRRLGAVYDEELQKELGMTSGQIEQLEAIRKETDEARQQLFANLRGPGGRGPGGGNPDQPNRGGQERRAGGGGPGAGFEGMRERMEEINKNNETKVLAVLTDAQKKKLEEMKGDAFEFPQPQFGGPGGRPGGDRNRDRAGNRPAT